MIVIDADNDITGTMELINKGLLFTDWIVSMSNPEIETWNGFGQSTFKRLPLNKKLTYIAEKIGQLDIDKLRSIDESLNTFYNTIVEF